MGTSMVDPSGRRMRVVSEVVPSPLRMKSLLFPSLPQFRQPPSAKFHVEFEVALFRSQDVMRWEDERSARIERSCIVGVNWAIVQEDRYGWG